MVKQELYKGPLYDQIGYRGKRILVVGHQKHATGPEKQEYESNPSYEYTYNQDNVELINSLIDGTWKEWENSTDRRSYLQFGRMLSGDRYLELDSEKSIVLWQSIAFCNYLQIPDFNLNARQGKDKEDLYLYSERIFQEYLEECKPDSIIVWGRYAYPYVAKFGENDDGKHCDIILGTGKISKVFRINHPCRVGRGGYQREIDEISEFLEG